MKTVSEPFILHTYVVACTVWLVMYGDLESVSVLRRPMNRRYIITLALSLAAQCIVIGPFCMCVSLFVCLFAGLFVCGSVTTITRNCVHRSSPNWVCM